MAVGEKRLLGLRQGATENAAVVTSLLEELRDRGVRTDVPTLFVLNGAKALLAAVVRVWGKFAVIQRCQVHKWRNVAAHLPEKHHEELDRRLSAAYHETNATQALALLRSTVQRLRRISLAAAALIDLKEEIKHRPFFPVTSYSIKEVAPVCGPQWSQADVDGQSAQLMYLEWLKTGDRTIIERVGQYNREDVMAMLAVDNFVSQLHSG